MFPGGSKIDERTKMKSGLFLNIIIRKCTTILELFAGKNQTLLVGGDAAE